MKGVELFERLFFGTPTTSAERAVRWAWLVALFLLGIVFWSEFFNHGHLSLVADDWVKESAYLSTIRASLTEGVLPWRWSEYFYHSTREFLANPEVVLTPDVLVLPWLSNGGFVLLHVLLFYVAGFIGSLCVAERYEASLASLSLFWLLFNFNGYLSAHLAVGHFQWVGYFLLPFFFLLIERLTRESRRTVSLRRSAVPATVLLFGVLFLNGSVHIAVWLLLFATLSVLWRPSLLKWVAASVLGAALIGLGRLLPAALYFPGKGEFITGYPDLGILLDALTTLRWHDFAMLGSGPVRRAGWWEFDVYVGFTAFLLLVVCSVLALRAEAEHEWSLLGPAGLLGLLSLGNVYAVVASAPLPLVSVERVSSRFIAIPLVMSLILTMRGMDVWIRRWPRGGRIAFLLGLPLVTVELLQHARLWQLARLERGFRNVAAPELGILTFGDTGYAIAVYVGWSVSLTMFLVSTILLLRAATRRGAKD